MYGTCFAKFTVVLRASYEACFTMIAIHCIKSQTFYSAAEIGQDVVSAAKYPSNVKRHKSVYSKTAKL